MLWGREGKRSKEGLVQDWPLGHWTSRRDYLGTLSQPKRSTPGEITESGLAGVASQTLCDDLCLGSYYMRVTRGGPIMVLMPAMESHCVGP